MKVVTKLMRHLCSLCSEGYWQIINKHKQRLIGRIHRIDSQRDAKKEMGEKKTIQRY